MPATVAVGDGTGPWPPSPRPASSPALVAACAPAPRFRSSVRSAPATAAGCLWPVAGGAWKGHSLAQPHRAHGRIGTPGAGRRLLLPPRLPPRLRPRPPPELAPAGGPGQARGAGGWGVAPRTQPHRLAAAPGAEATKPAHLLSALAARPGAPSCPGASGPGRATPASALTPRPHATCPLWSLTPRPSCPVPVTPRSRPSPGLDTPEPGSWARYKSN